MRTRAQRRQIRTRFRIWPELTVGSWIGAGAEAKQVSPLPAKMGGGGNDRAISAKAPLSGNPYNGAKGGDIKSASAGRFRCSFWGCIHAIDGLRCAYGAVQKACSGRPCPAPEGQKALPLPVKMGGGGNNCAIRPKAPLSGNPYNGKGGDIKSASAGRFRCSFWGCIHAIDGLRCAYGAVQKACSGRPCPAPEGQKALPLPVKMGGGGNDCAISAKAPLPGNPYNGAFACGIRP